MISRELASDPMQNKRLVKQYEKAVEKQFKLLKSKVKTLFPAEVPALDLDALEAAYLVLINQYITLPVQRQVLDYVSKTSYQGTYSAIQNLKQIGFMAAVGVMPVDPKVLDILNSRNISALKGITDEMAKTFKAQLSEGILAGEGSEILAKRIKNSIDVPMKRARVMVRTETAFAFNTARVDQFKKYNVEKVRWFTARDERVCTKKVNASDGNTYYGCKSLHNKEFEIGEIPPCPLHCSCRCTLLAVVPEVD